MNFGGLPYKTKQFFFVLIKLSIVVGAFYFIYNKLTNNDALDFNDFLLFLRENNVFSLKNTLILLILTGFNWFFEILKWKILVRFIKPISFKNALEQTLGALTASLFTPNRIGDYGAKALYYPHQLRKKIMLLNVVGNMIQMTLTLVFGSIGLYLVHSTYGINFNFFRMSRFLTVIGAITILTCFGLKQTKYRIKGFSVERLIPFFKNIPTTIIRSTVLLALIRYIIFSFQFYFLLHIFGTHLSYCESMVFITSMYLIASIIPSIFIFDVLIKGSIAVYLFSILGIDDLTILSIVMLMWLLNFMIPSLCGSYFVLNFKFPKSNS
jgi:hypothetical protein